MKRLLILCTFFAISIYFFPVVISAQDEEIPAEDSTQIWDDNFWENEEVSSVVKKNTVIEITYGMGQPSIHKDDFNSDFSKINSIEARFGFSEKKEQLFDNSIFEYDYKYFFLGNFTSEWQNPSGADTMDLNTDSWQFGFTNSDGYGYNLGEKSDITLYNSRAIVWTKINFFDRSTNPDTNLANIDNAKMDYFGNSFRFGDYWEGGIKFQVYEPFAITAGYQRHLVMQRHLFWYWAGSRIVEGVGGEIVTWFSEKVIESSPKFGPIVYFILTNAYEYGFYELRKKSMNWPFDTEAPIMYDNFKIGLSFSF